MTRGLGALGFALAGLIVPVGQDFSPAIRHPAVIRGHVTDATGRPLRLVHVDAVGASGSSSAGAITGIDGHYELSVPAPDAYIITASKSGYATVEFGQQRPGEVGTRVRMASSETAERTDFTLPRAGAISGRVVDENGDPIEGATVSLLESQFVDGRGRLLTSGKDGSRRQSDDRGRFRLFGIQPGRYILAATVASAGPHRLTGYATTYYPGAANATEAEPLAIGGGDDRPVEIHMLPGRASKVSGTAFNSRGDPYGGRLLISRSQRSGAIAEMPAAATVHADGSFEFTNVAGGDYVIQAVERGFPGGEFAFQYVTVADADVGGITIRTSPGSTMHGHIVLEGGTRSITPQDFKFQFIQTDFDRSPSGTYRAKINDDWTVDMVGLTGPLRIRPTGGPEWLLKSVRAGGVDITDDVVPFGRRDDSLGDVEVVMTTRGASVTGTVVDARREAVSDYVVVVFAADSARWYPQSRFVKMARSAADGTFDVRGLPSADFLVAALPRPPAAESFEEWQDPARLESLAASATRVTLTEGERTTVSLRLRERQD